MKLQLNDIINHLLSFNSTDLDIDVKSSELKIKSKYSKDSEDLFILEKINNTDFTFDSESQSFISRIKNENNLVLAQYPTEEMIRLKIYMNNLEAE